MACLKQKVVQKVTAEFKINDVVFAKMRGYTNWPAQIAQVDGKRWTVVFFGSYDWYVFSTLRFDSFFHCLIASTFCIQGAPFLKTHFLQSGQSKTIRLLKKIKKTQNLCGRGKNAYSSLKHYSVAKWNKQQHHHRTPSMYIHRKKYPQQQI